MWGEVYAPGVPLVVKAALTMLESLVIAKPNLACYSLGSLWVTETASAIRCAAQGPRSAIIADLGLT
ncbi:hypothetical protein D3C72_1213310 [compost metagenome]